MTKGLKDQDLSPPGGGASGAEEQPADEGAQGPGLVSA